MAKTVIIDLDGICFDPTERLNRCKKEDGKIDWERAFSNEEVAQDPVIKGAPRSTRRIKARFDVLYLTGRNEDCLEATYAALDNNKFAKGYMISMRKRWDYRPDHEVKAERIEHHRKMHKMNFVAAIDDDYNGKLKPMYEALGIPCFTSFQAFFASEIWRSI